MPEQPHLPHFVLKVDGQVAPPDAMNAMLDCTVENSLNLPDMCQVRMHDSGFRWLDSDLFKEGKRLQISATVSTREPDKPIFDGEIVGLELDLAAHGVPTMLVRAFDRSHRLHRGRISRSFQQVTDADIVRRVGQEAGFSVQADATTEVYDWVFQNNQTNWEFLLERAGRIGFRIYVQGESNLYFKAIQDDPGEPVQLDWGTTLRSFRPRTAASPQVDEVIVRGWDPGRKEAIVGRATTPSGVPQIGDASPGGVVANRAFGGAQARMVVVDRPVFTQGEADNLARSVCDEIGGAFLEAEGLAQGNPAIVPGKAVKIQNIGQRFSGRYFVTSTSHVYSPKEGYSTLFTVSGKRAATVLSLIDGDGMAHRAPLGGNVVIGVVTNNEDPEGQGRVKVKYPWLSEDDESWWVRQAAPMAGKGRGFYYIPEVDDEVLIAFEHGDIRRPYILGTLWNGKDNTVEPSSEAVRNGQVNRRMLKSRIGHTVLLDDTDGKGEVRLQTAGGHVVTLDDANRNITVRTTQGHTVTLDDSGNKIQVVDSTGSNKMTIESGGGAISLECVGNFSVNAQGSVDIQGLGGMTLHTPATLTIQGSMVNIN